jgi:2-polyprenyl-3-methyl-5-hydroxy-6-metoxy-1,4-benzoquinol methylase
MKTQPSLPRSLRTNQYDADDRVFAARAVRSPGTAVESDPEPMVQQQYARLNFFEHQLGTDARRILDWGCGSGFNCQCLLRTPDREVVGFDISPEAIELARRCYPGIDFRVADACDPELDLGAYSWDRVISCEVLEHVPDMRAFVANLRRHLAPGGAAFVSTPNRLVFSLGYEPSPVNREHIRELTRTELLALLAPHFNRVEIYGQRFKDSRLLERWRADVRAKIRECEAGTRWLERQPVRTWLRKWRAVDWAYRVPALRDAWRAVRWRLAGRLQRALWPAPPPYLWSDFEFVIGDPHDALWFCAVLRN